MEITNKTIAYSIIIFIISLICYNLLKSFVYSEAMVVIKRLSDVKYTQDNCKYKIGELFEEVMGENNIKKSTDTNDWMLYIPCTYNNIDADVYNVRKLLKDNNRKGQKKIFIIPGTDELTAKELLWEHIKEYHGEDKALTMMPITFNLFKKEDLQKLIRHYDPKKLYIMKKNIQRQEGLKITNSLNEMLSGAHNRYVIIQELLQDPYIISGRKINMRFYVLVVSNCKQTDVYVYGDGFMYYTAKMFETNSHETGPNITTGYIERKVYEENPLTHQDLRIYLDNKSRLLTSTEKLYKSKGIILSDFVFNNIYNLLADVFVAYKNLFCTIQFIDKYGEPAVIYQLYGVDIAVNNKLKPMIMEVNKGPDMGAKDARDRALKKGVIEEIYDMIGMKTKLMSKSSRKFINLLEINDNHIKKYNQ